MAQHNDFGKESELAAIEFLKNKNYIILDTNWRYSHLEIDIIAQIQNIIVFVEVKARKTNYLNFEEIVTQKKQENIINLAETYLEEKNLDNEIRFDVIFVTKTKKALTINHIENAFYNIL